MMHPLIRDEDINTLLQDILELYGYDFTAYAKASLRRRITRLMGLDRFPSFAEFRFRIINDPAYLTRFIEQVSVNVTEMFRDPEFYKLLRARVLPVLATYPHIRIWHAGCASGEEVYSMAIMLQEENLLHKTLLYATDINPEALETARRGIYKLSSMKQYSENYIASGGKRSLPDYYIANYEHVRMDDSLMKRAILSTHNLVSDSSFNEFQLILCRNVLIYFEKDLQNVVIRLFDASLDHLGYLALGSKETLRFSELSDRYAQLENEKIWRRTL
jgi:chemotaxis protein methyltransferase CheR